MNHKVAIVHDWLVTNGGAEKVLKSIIKIFPNADIYTLVNHLAPQERVEILGNRPIKSSFIQNLPFSKKNFRKYIFFFPIAIESFDLSSYDLIISSSWAVAKGVKKKKDQLHISYCYTPIRYAWDLYDTYLEGLPTIKKLFFKLSMKKIREWDIKSLDRVDHFIADSIFVKERRKRIYNKDSTVIYPPVDTESFHLCEDKDDYYITVSRLVKYKKTKLIVEAFNQMPDKRLVVIGTGEEYEKIKEIAKDNIYLSGFLNKNELVKKVKKAKGFVYAAVEDFGIAPIEAMACGTPVIALNKGGTAETVINNVNGLHFNNQSKEDICKAVEKFETLSFDYKKVRETTFKYTKFETLFKKFVFAKFKEHYKSPIASYGIQ